MTEKIQMPGKNRKKAVAIRNSVKTSMIKGVRAVKMNELSNRNGNGMMMLSNSLTTIKLRTTVINKRIMRTP